MRTTPLSVKRGKGNNGSMINCYENKNKLAIVRTVCNAMTGITSQRGESLIWLYS